jgi:hypothetical protein
MTRWAHRVRVGLLGLTLLTTTASAVAATRSNANANSASSSTSSVTFSGDAAVVAFSKADTGQTLLLGETGVLLGSGGNLSIGLGATNILSNPFSQGLTLESGTALSTGANNASHSQATVNNFVVIVLATNGTLHTITFNQLQVEATATATAQGVVAIGQTTVNGLTIDGAAVMVTGQANQVVAFSGGTVTINAQSGSASQNQGEIDVSGLFIMVEGYMSGSVGLARAGISFTGTPPSPSPTTIEFSGEATVAAVVNAQTGESVSIGETGELLSTGNSLGVTVNSTSITVNGVANALTFQSAESLTGGANNQTHSEATINNFSLIVPAANGTLHTIAFSYLHVEANATATASGPVTTASTSISGLAIDNVAVKATGKANQTIHVQGGLTIVINAQVRSKSRSQAEISLSGLFISVGGSLSAQIGFVRAGISVSGKTQGGGPPPATCDKLTGGGFIVGTPSGAHGSFGVSGGIRRGEFWGHVNYIDHGTGMHVRSTAVTGYTNVGGNTRKIDYTVDINGQAGTCSVLATDNGEPGRNDRFDITVSNGYHAAGDLGGSGSGGGNIQLHKCPPGWAK